MFTKKRMLSLAACTLLCGSVYASSNTKYVPLSTETADNAWVMFGVNGFSDGVASGSSTAGLFSDSVTTVVDTSATDDAATSGIQDSGANGDLVSIQALANATQALTGLTVGIDVTGVIFKSTDPVRSMYIDLTGDGAPDTKIDYKASLEGKTIEIQDTGSDDESVYKTTISETNTWDNPAEVTLETITSGGTDMTSFDDVIDYNLKNNPSSTSSYHKVTNQDSARAGTTARFYTYDSVAQSWKLYDIANSAIANDFTDLEKGRGYWGKIDVDGDGSAALAEEGRAGLVLGTSNATTTADETVYSGQLADGWNLMSFDDINPKITHASTGLILTTVAAKNMTIWDSTLTHSISVLTYAAGENTALVINKAIEIAKIKGEIPEDMNIKAFRGGSALEVVILSDKKFSVKDADGAIGKATTIAGNNVWDINANKKIDYDGDVTADGISSVYGEYAMIIEPLTGVDTASALEIANFTGTHESSAIQINDNETPVYIKTNLAAAESAIESDDAFVDDTAVDSSNGIATQLDMDFSGVTETLLLATNEPFYVKDHTFVKVYTYDGADTTSASFKVNATNDSTDSTLSSASVEITTDANIATTVGNINAVANANATTTINDTGVFAYDENAVNANDKMILVSATDPYFSIKDSASSLYEFVRDTTSAHNVAKGAVKGVYSIDKMVSKKIVPNKFVITGFELPNDNGDQYGVQINDTAVTDAALSVSAIAETDTSDKKAFFDDLVAQFNVNIAAAAATAAVDAIATHNYTEADNQSASSVKITIEGYGITAAVTTEVADENNNSDFALAGTDSNAATLDTISGLTPDLTSDLKFNPIYTPTYVLDGPVSVIKSAGFLPKAMISATTDIKTTGNIEWSNIDMTKTNEEWFDNNEYNLFNISNSAAYWVYLESGYTPPTITITNANFTPSFTYSFNTDNTTVNNMIGGTFTVQVDGIDTNTALVQATVDAKKVELIAQGSNYSAMITKYETAGIVEGSDEVISVTASNGFGDSITESDLYTVDYTKPATPTVVIENGLATLSSDSADVAKYYIFEDYIPEDDTSSSANDASSYNICEQYAFGTTTSLKAVAVDGTGLFGGANVSDALAFDYTNIIRNSYVLMHTYDATGETFAQTGDLYSETCIATPDTNQYGVSLKTIKTDATAKLSFAVDTNAKFDNTTPVTRYYSVDGITSDIQVKSVLEYNGKVFYVQISDNIYTGTFGNSDGTSSTNLGTLTLMTSETQTF